MLHPRCGCIVHSSCRMAMYRQRSAKRVPSESPPPALTTRRIKLRIVMNSENIQTIEPNDSTESQLHFASYGFVRVKATDITRTLAWKFMEADRGVATSSGVDIISGNVRQYNLAQGIRQQRFASLLGEWTEVVKDLASSLNILVEGLHVIDSKLLVAQPKSGHQPVHFDCERGSEAYSKYVALLFCSTGSYSTALPKFTFNKALSFSKDPSEMQTVTDLLKPDQYESLPVYPGDMVFFRQSTPHFGVNNTSPRDNRVVLFSILSSSAQPHQDDQQVLPWLFVGEAYSWDSIEFAKSLIDYKQFQPLEQISADFGEEATRKCTALLTRFNLLSSYMQ